MSNEWTNAKTADLVNLIAVIDNAPNAAECSDLRAKVVDALALRGIGVQSADVFVLSMADLLAKAERVA